MKKLLGTAIAGVMAFGASVAQAADDVTLQLKSISCLM